MLLIVIDFNVPYIRSAMRLKELAAAAADTAKAWGTSDCALLAAMPVHVKEDCTGQTLTEEIASLEKIFRTVGFKGGLDILMLLQQPASSSNSWNQDNHMACKAGVSETVSHLRSISVEESSRFRSTR